MRGFAFMVAFWGDKHRQYFLDWLLPSLLAPGNIPALINKQDSRFLIATTDEDWNIIRQHKTYLEMHKHIQVWPYLIGRGTIIQRCGRAFKRMTDFAWRYRLYGTLLVPDQIVSNKAVIELQSLAATGTQLVLVPALRYSQEKFERTLYVDRQISSSVLRDVAMGCFHPEMSNYNWDGLGRPSISSIYWRKLNSGIVLCTASWQPLLIDYAAIKVHDVSMLGPQHIDGGYVWANCKGLKTVTNPNLFAASFTPEAEGPQPRTIPKPFGWLQEVFHRDTVRRTFSLKAFSQVPKEMLQPVVWGTTSQANFSITQFVGEKPSFWIKALDFLFDLPHFAKNRLFRKRQFGYV